MKIFGFFDLRGPLKSNIIVHTAYSPTKVKWKSDQCQGWRWVQVSWKSIKNWPSCGPSNVRLYNFFSKPPFIILNSACLSTIEPPIPCALLTNHFCKLWSKDVQHNPQNSTPKYPSHGKKNKKTQSQISKSKIAQFKKKWAEHDK